MNLKKLDLNLFVVMNALLEERSTTAAARRLGITQPSVSAALVRLRAMFDDELFTRTPTGLQPTRRALEIEAPIQHLMQTVEDEILSYTHFDPASSARTFVLILGDMGQMLFVSRIHARLRALAPEVGIKVSACIASERQSALADGQADLAIGYFPEFDRSDMYQQQLYASRPPLCVLRADHPRLEQGTLTLDAFARMEHAVVGTEGNYVQLYEAALRRLGVERRVVLELPGTAGAGELLAGSDLVAILPAAFAEACCLDPRLVALPTPFDLPACEVKQFWHRKVNHDPAVSWLRAIVAQEFQKR